MKRHSPDFTQLPPGHRTCSFISHFKFNFPGSNSPAAIFSTQYYSNTHAFTVPPGTQLLLGRESACVSKVPCLGVQHRRIFSAVWDRTHGLLLVHSAHCHWATTPHHKSTVRRQAGWWKKHTVSQCLTSQTLDCKLAWCMQYTSNVSHFWSQCYYCYLLVLLFHC